MENYLSTRTLYFALGYGGNGITFGMIAADSIRDWWVESAASDQALFTFSTGYREARDPFETGWPSTLR